MAAILTRVQPGLGALLACAVAVLACRPENPPATHASNANTAARAASHGGAPSAHSAPSGSEGPPSQHPIAAPASDTDASVAEMVPVEHTLQERSVRLQATKGRCELLLDLAPASKTKVGVASPSGATSPLGLDLAPPCYVLVWNAPPPRLRGGRSESGGLPIGSAGEVMAWKYPTARGTTVLAVIGDAVLPSGPNDELHEQRKAQKFRCAGSLQGVKLTATGATLSPKRAQASVFCVETALDEKDFWMLAHD